ncbi:MULTISPECIES: ECF transporter S component [Microbacterium]|uniref:ECF transporter S component n=1 Tax=Microbacterium TaxID=33882 RepID=UPI00217D7B3B|nr:MULTISPECIES: ECF transporter S component [Microbacterium]UWF77707.1 ECF transporter S component [Microbacterium neungamense]WCM55876.1 ECF transporter S component [Microbacterium sp. EF45047]
MSTRTVLSTRALLVCAAIGVATGILGGVAGLLTVPVIAGPLAFLYGLVLGVHVLPGIVAQEVLRQPLVALVTHVIAALISSAFNPAWTVRFIGTALLFGAVQEGVAALTRYRSWGAWRFFVSAIVIGGLIGVIVWFAVDLERFPAWAQLAYLAFSLVGPVAWTAVGLATGSALTRAGVTRR